MTATLRWAPLLLALSPTACDPPSASSFAPVAPPPVSVELRRVALPIDRPARVELWTSAPPGARVRLFAGRGAPRPGVCNGGLPGVCVQIAAPRVLGDTQVDVHGLAFIAGELDPAWRIGDVVRVQAVVGLPGGPSAASPVVMERVAASEGPPAGWSGEVDCADGRDDDGDGPADCADPDCVTRCPERGCADGADQDRDGLIDCADADCRGAPETCADGADGDCDGLVDCADPDCSSDPRCAERDCADGRDDDGDGAIDCADADCDLLARCVEVDCADRYDDDHNGRIDCADPDCQRPGLCLERACADGRDDDHDGLADCEDGDCMHDLACFEADCADGRDGDADGDADCTDEDCWRLPACHASVVAWTVAGYARLTERVGSRVPGALEVDSVIGRVRVEGPLVGGVQTCSWFVDHASAALGGGPASRSRVKVGRECLVDEEALPPIDVGLWGPGWYGGWDASSEATVVVGGRPIVERRARSGPDLEGAAWGACPRGVAPVAGWLDEDGDGSGVSGVDRWGVLGGRRFFCGPLPEGYARSGGDCDDLDPAWSPDSVRLAPGSDCLGVLPDDLDADGTISLFDPDDRDGSVR